MGGWGKSRLMTISVQLKLKLGLSLAKIIIVGSKVDEKHYLENSLWTMSGKKIAVSENNEHLSLTQVVSGDNQITKNIDKSLQNGRKSLFALMGPAFSYKCLLGPFV